MPGDWDGRWSTMRGRRAIRQLPYRNRGWHAADSGPAATAGCRNLAGRRWRLLASIWARSMPNWWRRLVRGQQPEPSHLLPLREPRPRCRNQAWWLPPGGRDVECHPTPFRAGPKGTMATPRPPNGRLDEGGFGKLPMLGGDRTLAARYAQQLRARVSQRCHSSSCSLRSRAARATASHPDRNHLPIRSASTESGRALDAAATFCRV